MKSKMRIWQQSQNAQGRRVRSRISSPQMDPAVSREWTRDEIEEKPQKEVNVKYL